MDDGYKPVLKALGQREEPGTETMLWILIILVAIPLVLFVANYVRKKIRQRRELSRGYDHLLKLGQQHDLSYPEQMMAQRMATGANLHNPAQMLTSIDAFDRAAARWMAHVQKMPFLEVDAHVERLTSLREKLGFQSISPDRQPRNTRHLALGQKLYVLADGPKGFKLLSAPVVELDDLAIYTEPFKSGDRAVHLHRRHKMWALFWSPTGGEYRFSTEILREVARPAPYLMLRHGDELATNENRKVLSCDLNLELAADWLPASEYGRATPSPSLFDKDLSVETLLIRLNELSGSGLVLSADAEFEVNDLIRFTPGRTAPDFLEGKVARAVKITRRGVRFKFLKLSDEDREAILEYVTPRISRKALKKMTARSPAPA